MLSADAADLMWALRKHVGADKVGIGPDLPELLELVDMGHEQLLAAIEQLEQFHFIEVDRQMGAVQPELKENVPIGLAKIGGVRVLESMQEHCARREGC